MQSKCSHHFQVDFGEMVNFRTEIETQVNSGREEGKLEVRNIDPSRIVDDVQFYMKVELMFMEASEPEIKNPSVNIKHPLSDDKLKKFSPVSSRLYKLNQIIKGLNEYYPVAFDTLHFASMTISVHSAIMDFKFRK